MKFQVFTGQGAFFKLGGLVSGKVLSFYHGTLSTALIKSTDPDQSCNVKYMCSVSIELNM